MGVSTEAIGAVMSKAAPNRMKPGGAALPSPGRVIMVIHPETGVRTSTCTGLLVLSGSDRTISPASASVVIAANTAVSRSGEGSTGDVATLSAILSGPWPSV